MSQCLLFHYRSPGTAKLSQSHRKIQARSLKTRVMLLQSLRKTTPSRMPLDKNLAPTLSVSFVQYEE
jgi:hypothetical protein